jgi:hypothetical protein
MAGESFAQLKPSRKTGDEPFRDGTQPLSFNVRSFWQWFASDLASNALRGCVAEFLVAQALGIADDGLRPEWDPYDLRTPGGTTIEVKCAAYLQTWWQKAPSAISFNIAPTRFWDAATNTTAAEIRRQADLYVFALLAHQDKATFEPMDVSQWSFFVLPTAILNERLPAQESLGLSRLRGLQPLECRFGELKEAIETAACGTGRDRQGSVGG